MTGSTATTGRGPLLVLAGAALWGTTGTVHTLAPDGASALSVSLLRLGIGAAGLLAFAAATGRLRSPAALPRTALLVAVVAMAASQPLWFAAVDRTGVAIAAVVSIGVAPVLTGGLGLALLGERVGRRWLVATTLAVAGATLLVTGGESVGVDPRGVVLAFLAGSAYAVYAVAAKYLLVAAEPVAVMAIVFTGAAVLLLPLPAVTSFTWVASPDGLAAALWLGLVTTSLAYVLFARGLRHTPVAAAVTLSLMEPLTATVAGFVVLDQHLGARALIGSAVLLAGILVLARPRTLGPGARPAPARIEGPG